MGLSIQQLAQKLNKNWNHESPELPTCLTPYEATQFHRCVVSYADRISKLEGVGDIAGTSEMLGEMALFLFSYVDRKGLMKLFTEITTICYDDTMKMLHVTEAGKRIEMITESGEVIPPEKGKDYKSAKQRIDELISEHVLLNKPEEDDQFNFLR